MLRERLKENLKQHAPVAFIKSFSESGGIGALARLGDKQIEYLLGLETSMQSTGNNFLGKFFAEAVRFCQHVNQAAFSALDARSQQFGLRLHLAAAFGGRSAKRFPQNGFVHVQFGSDARGPPRAQQPVRKPLDVWHQKIESRHTSVRGSAIHQPRAANQIVQIRRGLCQKFLVGLGALLFQEFVRIGAARKRQHSHVELFFEQKYQRALCGRVSRGVRIVIHNDSPREPAEQFYLWLGKTRAAACYYVHDPSTRYSDGVHIAFHQNAEVILPRRFLGPVKMVEDSALRIDGRLGRVQILGHVVAHRASAERDHFPRFVGYREHNAPAKTIEEAAAWVAGQKTRCFEQLFRIFLFHKPQQGIARRGRIPQPEFRHRFAIKPAVFEIRKCNLSFGTLMQLTGEESCNLAVHLYKRTSLLILAAFLRRTLARPGNRDSALLRDCAYRFRKRALLQLHHEFENIAARAAAKAVVNLLHRMHGERRRLLLVERTQPGEVLSAFLQTHVLADHADYVRLLLHPLRK